MRSQFTKSTPRLAALVIGAGLAGVLHAQTAYDTGHTNVMLRYDEVTARIPANDAPIASVALARLTIVLRKAKSRTEQILCQGHWTPSGNILDHSGPTVAAPTPDAGGTWHYRAIREPHPLHCNTVSRSEYFLELSRHLPDWVSVRPAGQLTAFRQGNIETLHTTSIASR